MDIRLIKTDAQGDILETLREESFHFEGKARVTIPAGFRSDGASVPRAFWWIVSPAIDPRTIRAAICHDFLYRNSPQDWTRAEADRLFRDYSIEDGLPRWRAYIAYAGLRAFGGANWRGGTSDD